MNYGAVQDVHAHFARAVPHGTEIWNWWIDQVEVPDANDAHVVAAAIECGATTIVTSNLKDFPGERLARFEVEAVDPDAFVMRCIDANPVIAASSFDEAPSRERLLNRLEHGNPRSIARVRALLS